MKIHTRFLIFDFHEIDVIANNKTSNKILSR